MSHFDKLSIQGIRCFGPDQSDVGIIKFGLPLTLILGNNGCGKTTIIEALNFATCGELPPGCSGQGRSNFVHDPKLTNKSDVRGQIRLAVKDVNGRAVSVSRTVQVTQKAAKAQFKSVDQVVNRLDDEGTWNSITGRCADADTEMCIALGISKAILSNVLLCHQEDSNWPLDEDSKVKAKFDEIFGSDRYNKCLDELKSTHKKLHEDESKLKIELGNLKTFKEDASMVRTRLEDAQMRFETYEAKIEDVDSALGPIQSKIKKLAEKDDEISQLRSCLELHRAKLESVRSAMLDLKKSIEYEFRGSKDELEKAINNFTEELSEKEKSLEGLENRACDVARKLRKNQDSLSLEERRLGQLNADLEANKKRQDSRAQAMLSLSDMIGLTISPTQLSQSDTVQSVLSDLEAGILQKQSEIDLVDKKHKESVESLQKQTTQIRENRVKIDSNIRTKKEQLKKNKEELQKVNSSISEADQSMDLLGKLQVKLDKVKKEYDNLMRTEDIDSLKEDISSRKKESTRLDDSLINLEKEIGNLQTMSSVQTELDIQKQAKEVLDSKITKLKSRHESTLKEILQVDELPEQGIRFHLDARIDQFSDTVKSKSELLTKTERDIAGKEADNRHIAQKLKESRQQFESDTLAVTQACDGQDYDRYTHELEKELEDLRDEKGTLSSSEHFFRRCVQKLQKQEPCCPLCKRDFASNNEVSSLVSELTQKVKDVPSSLRKNKEKLNEVQEKYDKLMRLKPKYDKLGVLKTTEIPTLEANFERSNRELSKLKNLKVELQEELEGPKLLEEMAKSIQSDICILEQHIGESKRLGKEVAKLQEKLKGTFGSGKTLAESLNEQKSTRAQLQKNQRVLTDLENKLKTIESKKIRLQEEKHSIQDQQFKISGNVQQRAQLSEKKEELEGVESAIQIEIDELSLQFAEASRQVEQIERKMRALKAANHAEIEELNKTMTEINGKFQTIQMLSQDIVDYEMSGKLKRLESCKETIEELNKERDEFNHEKETTADRIDKIKNEISSQKTRERNLKDNLSLRNKMIEEQSYAKEVDKLNDQIGGMNCASIFEERKRLQIQETKLFSQKKEIEGSLVELKKSIAGLKGDLEKPHFKFAEKNFCDAAVHCEVVAQAMKDVDNFYKALDWAMMSYHQKKIKHINNVIQGLWRKVYSGNDIDGIKIVAEQETTASAVRRRAYKYRVVQTKCAQDLDMRNRCSAGQKVLACLIIRMALAETFSSRCGVLALDEPTTNLDQDNIINLSKVLKRLINMQANRKNFQLVIITHDQEFLKELTLLSCIDHYYKLDRTGEGKSKVIKVKVND